MRKPKAFLAAFAVMATIAVGIGAVDTPVTEPAVAQAGDQMPYCNASHAPVYWWAHGKKHGAFLDAHYSWVDYYNVYVLKQAYVGGPWQWYYHGRDSCWFWH